MERLHDDIVLAIWARAPFFCHDALKRCCTRFNSLLLSPHFHASRVAVGFIEHALFVIGLSRDDEHERIRVWDMIIGTFCECRRTDEFFDSNATVFVATY